LSDKADVDVLSSALQGLSQAQNQFEQSAARLTRSTTASPGSMAADTVDLSQEAVSLLAAKNQFAVGVDLLKTAENMQKSLINLLA